MNRAFARFIICLSIILSISLILYSLPQEKIINFSNYPNPFDSRIQNTEIIYELESDSEVTIKIYDLLGYPVREYSFSSGSNGGGQGWNRVVWNGENENGDKVAKGGYICWLYIDRGERFAQAYHKIGVIH